MENKTEPQKIYKIAKYPHTFKMIGLGKLFKILKAHGIDGIFDKSTGSSLAEDLGLAFYYKIEDVMKWLGY